MPSSPYEGGCRKMKSSDYRASIPVPPAEMILRYLNDEPRSKIDLLNYYENYIHSAAVEQVYTSDGDRKGFFVNDSASKTDESVFIK